jgi:signal transduction histidine kinase
MGGRTARWLAGSVATLSLALMVSGLALTYTNRHLVPASLNTWDFSDIFQDLVNLAVPVVGFVVASRRPENRIGWVFLAAGLGLALNAFCDPYAQRALIAVPGSLPAGRAVAWISNWIFVIQTAALSYLLLLFPTGRLRTRRWRPAAWFMALAFTLIFVTQLVRATRIWAEPFRAFPRGQVPGVLLATLILVPITLLIGITGLLVRYARSTGEERLQLKWFAAAALLVVATMIPAILIDSTLTTVLSNLAILCLFAAIGIAVLKYRLYDIDIVISKAVLYGSLAVFITAVYVGLVAGVGTLVGHRGSPLLAALAATVVAVAFQPVRQWAGRLANRVVYGRRATPYQVLSEFAQRIGGAYPHEDVLPQMARMVAGGTGAEQVVVWLRVDDELVPEAASKGRLDAVPQPVDGQDLPALPGTGLSVPVVHQGELLGAISVRMPRDEPLRPASEQLVADVASQAGLVLSNAGLIEDLRASRQRLVAAQDEARRRLERNIHDGAQQDLVALAIKVRIAKSAVDDDPAEAKELLGELQTDTAATLENLRDLARGIYPPLLADLGLVAALNAQASKSPVPVTVEADGIGRFGQDTEAAVYFCCLEALQNIGKYARATQARICLRAQNGNLSFTVSDDGAGYDARHTPLGSGQRNMADRLAALGGRLEVRSAPSQGTTITAHLPVPAAKLAADTAPSPAPAAKLAADT